ncbi:MAG: ABC transporter ATP-binding protein [candidate division Zixibacteria bacterium]|nr:ABC transporter ATP-binding protein [candidate division Zixibacteria bacterium]
MLKIDALDTGYGIKQVIYGLDFEILDNEIVSIIGPNGAGKSTLLKAICGLIPIWKGEIRFQGMLINNSVPYANVMRGITFAPQGGRVFQDLTVKENIEVGGFQLSKRALCNRFEYILDVFPPLKERLSQIAGSLSGGEQQMLSLARVLIPEPKLLMLDEPTLGLAPNYANLILDKIQEIMKGHSLSIIIVEQKVKDILEISDRVYSLKLGKKAFCGNSEELINDNTLIRKLFL